ncbi:DUF2167 domain-containing protein [Brevundimonas lenta]|uniref:Putative membrane-anchored protein n=1 Tax=Brevundimonas lenta TaxID=424796 RepID=A0A7W6JAU7_9CAUL|nr:DUF2167 domain-containing protein [Brevundimonas lenta]MBB4081701.1 putative membrane-anchored protein [Brevundimonas lenta]
MFVRLFAALAAALSLFAVTPALASPAAEAPTPEQAERLQQLQAIVDSLHPQYDTVVVRQADVTLNLGKAYYFLNAEEAKRVLTEGWGNPADSVTDVIGMIFPADKLFVDDTWGAVLTYSADGYVSDADANKIKPDELLTQLRQGEDQDNAARREAGFSTIHLVGWAQPPAYDAQKHNLIWAKELSFSDAGGAPNTLNYDVRVLGRRGVFSMNLVTGMEHLEATRADANRLMATATFNEGARYTDFKEGVDKKAAYGVAGLIAGGAVLAVAKKAGILGILFLILKKGGVFLIAGAGAAFAWLRNMFAGKKGGEFRTASARVAPATVDAEPDPGLAPIVQDETPPSTDERDKPL